MTQPTLVLITPPDDYKRFDARNFTHHVKSDGRSLTAQEVEQFRANPEKFFLSADEPEAA